MLVLSRKEGEAILIGDDIKIIILTLVGSRVRVGIEAPDGVKILRGELKKNKNRGVSEDDGVGN